MKRIRGNFLGIASIITVTILSSGCQIILNRPSICEVQGAGSSTPYLGKTVILQGVVSVDMSTHEPPGFFLHEICPEETGSQGIIVSLDKPIDWISTGDRIRLEGVVEEEDGETTILATSHKIEVLSIGEPVSDPVNLADQYCLDPFSFNYEDWEGRVVLLSEGLVLRGKDGESGLLLCPRFSSSFRNDLCALGLPFFLSIKEIINHPGLLAVAPGDMAADFVGVLRQERDGYYIQVLNTAGVRVKKNPPPRDEMVETAANHIITSYIVDTLTATLEEHKPPVSASASATATCNPTILPSITPVPSPTWYPVDILISEILPNPEGEEPDLEWVEIYNPNSYGIPLTGVKLGDAVSPEKKEGVLSFPDGWYIEGGEVLVIANKGASFQSWYGFFPDFEFYDSTNKVPELLPYPGWGGSKIILSNSGDEFLLIDPWDEIIDQVSYGKSSWSGFFPPAEAPGEGSSLERYPPEQDHDQARDWRVLAGGSPGWLDRSLPTVSPSMTLLPTPSVSPSPSFTTTAVPSLTITPFHSVTISPSPNLTIMPTKSHTHSPSMSATITASHTIIVPPTTTPTITPFLSPTSTPSPDFSVTPSHSPAVSSSPSPTGTLSQSPTVIAIPSLTITSSQSQTITLSPSVTATPSPSPSLSSSPSLTITPITGILINEIHADPHQELGDANGDGKVHSDDDEFLELVNTGAEQVDLSGWEIMDEVRSRFTFPPDTVLEGGCGLLIYGGELDIMEISGSQVFSTGSLGLNNQGDTIFLFDSDGDIYLSLIYGTEGGQDQSLSHYPDLDGNSPLIPHSEILEAAGRLFSPGTRVDGTSFGDCP